MTRNISLDILKVLLAILVVLIHLSFLRDKMVIVSQLFVNGICRLAVPLFLIISGYYFTSITTKEKLIKWVKRLAILYIIWMIIYSYRWIGVFSLKQIIFILGAGYLHLWYLIGTLLAGVLLYFVKDKPDKLPVYILLLFLLGYIIEVIFFLELINKDFYEPYFYRNFLFFCFPFMAIGYLLANHKYSNYSPSKWLVILSLILVLVESYIIFRILSNGGLVSFDLLLSSLLASPLIFLYVKNRQINGNTREIAIFSTAIYLIHPIVLHHIGILNIEGLSSLMQKVIVFAVIFLLSFLLMFINRKIKYLL